MDWSDAGEEGIWLLENDENDLRVFLSGTVCCFNSVKDNRITKVLSKRHVFLTPVRFEDWNWYDLLAELAFHSDLLKIEYATKRTKLLSQFQIEVNVSDFPSGLQSIPQLLKERLGIAKEFPINSVHIVRRNVTLRSSYIEHPDSSDSSRVLLEYLMRSSAS
ncbi:unnamed protein product [Kluyveromyces dobzhanskii CBS 2104]|uniref:WGS project CCBQ000000000 data, contig 00053 n=1 Tax=Kluyveromyces dobzhanskii CBS 2104 TaxID=1427455 RepID=A0A0A8L0Q1_9SACH|nr:unnamed protein product [Kluyveromyces dobzhanskii CBS 2104]